MNKAQVLVTGGCGYIGSVVCRSLRNQGFQPIVVDDLSTGFSELIDADTLLYIGNFGDVDLLTKMFSTHSIQAVLHFAARTVVSESMADPLAYYENNFVNTLQLLKMCHAYGVEHIVFSSTAAVYGNVTHSPVTENAAKHPMSPYGWSKLFAEQMIADTAQAKGMKYVALRYFNVAGATPEFDLGQKTRAATHLIKVACEVATGKRSHIEIYGTDYETRDGTCIRDFIHVSDLAEAHVLALRYLLQGGESDVFNCGYGRGHSVREVLDTVGRLSSHSLSTRLAPRRPGDIQEIVADSSKIKGKLGWLPRYDSLDFIVKTALQWEARNSASLPSAAAPGRLSEQPMA